MHVWLIPAVLCRYSEFPNQEAFFAAAKKSPRIIAHFYRGTTRFCEIVDAHMERLAPKHLETRVGGLTLSNTYQSVRHPPFSFVASALAVPVPTIHSLSIHAAHGWL